MTTVSRTRTHILFSRFLNADVKVKVKTVPNLDVGGRAHVVITVERIPEFPEFDGLPSLLQRELFCNIIRLAPSIRYHTGIEAARAGLATAEFNLCIQSR